MKAFTTGQLATALQGDLIGDDSVAITTPSYVEDAGAGSVVFIGHRSYISGWKDAQASAAVVRRALKSQLTDETRPIILVDNLDWAMAQTLLLFKREEPVFHTQIASDAHVDETARLGENVRIGSGAYVGAGVTLGDHVTLYPNVTVLDDVSIGAYSVLWPGVVVRERCILGRRVTLHNNVSIGADGFGYTPNPQTGMPTHIPHIGWVELGDDVEIGANSCIDRGKMGATKLGDGCKIDNLVQIGHNCQLGRGCIMAGASGLAGSVTLGDGVIIGGSASIKDHVSIGSGAVVGAGSGVTKDIPAGAKMLGYPAKEYYKMLRQWAAIDKWTAELD